MTEITDEQRAAWQRLDEIGAEDPSPETERLLLTIAPLLPSELTSPQPALPTEPGRYEDCDGDSGWVLYTSGRWSHDGDYNDTVTGDLQKHAPFTRLVPERPQITREQVEQAMRGSRGWAANVDATFALVNGADQ